MVSTTKTCNECGHKFLQTNNVVHKKDSTRCAKCIVGEDAKDLPESITDIIKQERIGLEIKKPMEDELGIINKQSERYLWYNLVANPVNNADLQPQVSQEVNDDGILSQIQAIECVRYDENPFGDDAEAVVTRPIEASRLIWSEPVNPTNNPEQQWVSRQYQGNISLDDAVQAQQYLNMSIVRRHGGTYNPFASSQIQFNTLNDDMP